MLMPLLDPIDNFVYLSPIYLIKLSPTDIVQLLANFDIYAAI